MTQQPQTNTKNGLKKMSEYTHNDDIADLLHEKEVEIRDLKKQVSKLLMHLEYVRAEISRLETEHYRGL